MTETHYNICIYNIKDNSIKSAARYTIQNSSPYYGYEIPKMNCSDNKMYLYTVANETGKPQDYIAEFDENGKLIRKINLENIDLLLNKATDEEGRIHYIRVINDYIVVGILGCCNNAIGIYDMDGNIVTTLRGGKYYCCENLLDNKSRYIPIKKSSCVYLFDCQSHKISTLEFDEEIDDALCYGNELLVTLEDNEEPVCYSINIVENLINN